MSLEDTKKWFDQAIPEPTDLHKVKQIGCHYEEVGEMASALEDNQLEIEINGYAEDYKKHYGSHAVDNIDKVKLLDSLADQIVTAVGVAHMFGFDIQGALEEVNRSNFSKFEDGKPVFDDNGKITKGKDYTPPNLKPYI